MYFKVNQENKLWYRFFGNKEKPLIVYLHGGPGGYHDLSLKKYINLKKYSFLTYDQRGCGKSKPYLITNGNTVVNNLKDLNKLVNHFSKNKKVILIGDSYGTQLALKYSLKYPKKVEKMILTGLWLGSKSDVENLYVTKAKKYNKIVSKLFGENLIDIKGNFNKIKNGKNIYNWLAWEQFLANNNKDDMKLKILNNQKLFRYSKEDKGIAFYESFYFSSKNYFLNAFKMSDMKKIKSKIELFQGKNDEVCKPLDTVWLKNNGIKHTVLKNMGHMPKSQKDHKIIFSSLS